MPYQIVKLKDNKVKVVNKKTGRVASKHTTMIKAKKQINILNRLDDLDK